MKLPSSSSASPIYTVSPVRCSVRVIAFSFLVILTHDNTKYNIKSIIIKFSLSCFRIFAIVLSCFRHCTFLFSSSYFVFSSSYFRISVIVFSNFRHRTFVFSSSYFLVFVIVLRVFVIVLSCFSHRVFEF